MPKPLPRQPEPEYMDGEPEAEAYAASDFSEVNQAFVDRLLQLIPETRPLRALDLGTGPGDIPIRLSLARPHWRIVAVDASPAMLRCARQAQKRTPDAGRIDWVLADAKDTRLPAHDFNVVFSNSILHHINDTAAFWTELKRLAAPGAYIFLRDLTRPETDEAAHAIVQTYGGVGPELMRKEYYESLLASYTLDEVRQQLARANLSALRVERITDRHMDVFGRLPE